jgi:hypothetical protein
MYGRFALQNIKEVDMAVFVKILNKIKRLILFKSKEV